MLNEVYDVVDKLGLIILAGGLSTRMGQPKALLSGLVVKVSYLMPRKGLMQMYMIF